MKLPPPIQAYFDADESNDGEALIRTFAHDATLDDERHAHAGRDAIEAWWRDTKIKYRHVIEPLEVSEADGVAKVRARVTGRFPGSPVVLTFAFRLEGGQIAGLDITE